jgi:hypothetical protein
MEFYGPGNDVSIYDSVYPGIYRGMRETYKGWQSQMQFKSIQIKFRELQTDSDGLFGSSFSTQDIVIAEKDGSIRKINQLRQRGKWYTLHEVVSFPVDPKTGKALYMESLATPSPH